MKKKTWLIPVGVLLLAVSMAFTALGANGDGTGPQTDTGMGMGQGRGMKQNVGRGGGMGGGIRMGAMQGIGMQMLERVLDDPAFVTAVGLSDTQVDQIRTKTSEARKNSIRTKSEMQLLQVDLTTLLNADNPNLSQVDAKIDAISELHARTMKDNIHLMVELKGMLSDEQLANLKQYIQDNRKQGKRGNNKNNKRNNKGGRSGGRGNLPAPDDDTFALDDYDADM